MLFQIHRQLIADQGIHQRADVGVAQLGLGLSFKLCLRQLHADHGGDALAAVLAADLVVALDHAVLHAVSVQHAGQRRLKTGLMHAALRRADIIGKGNDVFVVTVVILQGDLRRGVPLGAGNVNHFLMKRCLILIEVGHILPDTALIAHGVALLTTFALILDGNTQTCVQKCLLAHAGVKNGIVILHRVKHLVIGHKGNGGTGAVRLSHDLHLTDNITAGEGHLIDLPLLVYLYRQPLRQGVDHAGAHAVKAAGHLITAAAELAAGMQHRKHHFQSGTARLGLNVHGNTASVVRHGDGSILIDGNLDLRAVAGQGLIDGVVHDLIYQVMET